MFDHDIIPSHFHSESILLLGSVFTTIVENVASAIAAGILNKKRVLSSPTDNNYFI